MRRFYTCFILAFLLTFVLPQSIFAQGAPTDACPNILVNNVNVRTAQAKFDSNTNVISIIAGGNLQPDWEYILMIDAIWSEDTKIKPAPGTNTVYWVLDKNNRSINGKRTNSLAFLNQAFEPTLHSIKVTLNPPGNGTVCSARDAYGITVVPISTDCDIKPIYTPADRNAFLPGEVIILAGRLSPVYNQRRVKVELYDPSGSLRYTNCTSVFDSATGGKNIFRFDGAGQMGIPNYWHARFFQPKDIPLLCDREFNAEICPNVPFQVTALSPLPPAPPGSTTGVVGKRDFCQLPKNAGVNQDCAGCLGNIVDVQTGQREKEGVKAWTALGCIDMNIIGFVSFLIQILLGTAGGIAFLMILFTGFKIITSQGNAEAIQGAKETLTSIMVGLLFMIFSVFILQLITVNILALPGFGR